MVQERSAAILNTTDPGVPPRSLLRMQSSESPKTRQGIKNLLIEQAKLHPEGQILDIGCGEGKFASALTPYLSAEGEYWGFDIRKEVIEWCQTHISRKHVNFHFLLTDIFNAQYNPRGVVQAKDYKLPFEDACFDLVFFISVFPHITLEEVENYLGEAARVLKVGGTCLSTQFLYDRQVKEGLRLGKMNFEPQGEHTLMVRGHQNEISIAIEEGYFYALHAERGLEIRQILRSRTGLENTTYMSAQNIVLATRKQAVARGGTQ